MRTITQEASMGCAIACCASLAGLSYKQMRRLFEQGEVKDCSSGFYNRDIVQALKKVGINTRAYSLRQWGKKKIKEGTIVFVGPSKQYPAGHYLLKTKQGWMNPWINSPNIRPAKGGLQRDLPASPRWYISPLS